MSDINEIMAGLDKIGERLTNLETHIRVSAPYRPLYPASKPAL